MININKPGHTEIISKDALNFRRAISLLLIIFIIFHNNSNSQSLPKVIAPSPETSALFKAVDYPVDFSTGVQAIYIPIYEVRSGTLTVPINLSYHATGRKVTDQNGPIALGWSLHAGGIISRTIYGSPDFGSPSVGTYPFASPLLLEEHLGDAKTEADFHYFAGIEQNRKAINYGRGVDTWRDSEYDIFSYSFNGNNGKFIFKDSLGIRMPALVPIKPYQITWEGKHLSFINITDDKGTIYRFGQGEDYLYNGTTSVVTNWTIRSIISADKKDTITFKYTGFYEETYTVNQQYILKDNWQITQNSNPVPFPDEYFSRQESPGMGNGYQMQRLTEIKFKEGRVKFNLYTNMPRESTLHGNMVQEIQITDKENKVFKTIALTQSFLNGFAGGAPAVNKLDQIQFRDRDGHTVDKYSFEYYPVRFLSAAGNYIDLKHCDWWGYYNASGASNMLAPVTVNFMGSGGSSSTQTFGASDSNRKPALEAIKSGILKKITYPTGGSIEFTYGLNKYKDDHTSLQANGGGIRIEQTKSSDAHGNIYYKTYEYRTKGFGETDWGTMLLQPHPEYMASESRYMFFNHGNCVSYEPACMAMGGSYRERTFYSGFLPSLNALAEKPVVYDLVTEYQGTKENNIGKTVYYFDFFRQSPGALSFSSGISMYRYHVYMNRLWQENVLLKKEIYEHTTATNTYTLRKQLVNRYEDIIKEEVKGLHVERTHIFPQDKTLYDVAAGSKYVDLYASVYWHERTQVYAYRSYVIAIGAKNLVSTSEMDITDSGNAISFTTSYKYNPKQLVSEISTEASNKQTVITRKKYPFDLIADPVHQTMISKNILDVEVEQNQYKDTFATMPLQSIKTHYKDWGNNILAPELITKGFGYHPVKPFVRFHAYDLASGQILRVSKEKDVSISYIWGYHKTFPIAECKNATESQIFYDGFEDQGNPGLAHSGNKFHDGDYYLQFVPPDQRKYVLSYWFRENGVWNFSGLLSYSGPLTLSQGDALDDVRLYPLGALMTTYTYQPLVGMTSSTDPNNKVSYYEYDSFGRLKYVRDEAHDILNAYQYHYQVR